MAIEILVTGTVSVERTRASAHPRPRSMCMSARLSLSLLSTQSSQIYTSRMQSIYTKQEEVKRGYGADVTLRDIKRRSILSSRRNTPPKKSTAGVRKKVYSFFVYSLFTHRFCWFIRFVLSLAPSDSRFGLFFSIGSLLCVILCWCFFFAVQHIFFRSQQICYTGYECWARWIKWNWNAVRVLIKPI